MLERSEDNLTSVARGLSGGVLAPASSYTTQSMSASSSRMAAKLDQSIRESSKAKSEQMTTALCERDDALDRIVSDLCEVNKELEDTKIEFFRLEVEIGMLQGQNVALAAELKMKNNTIEQMNNKARAEVTSSTTHAPRYELSSGVALAHNPQFGEIWQKQIDCLEHQSEDDLLSQAPRKDAIRNSEAKQLSATSEDDDLTTILLPPIVAQSETSKSSSRTHELDHIQTLYNASLSQLQTEKDRADKDLQELDTMQLSQPACILQSKILKAVAGLQDAGVEDLSQSVSVESREKNDDAMERLKVDHATALDELHRLSDFFKTNSERLSRQVMEGMADKKKLQEAFDVLRKDLDDRNDLVDTLRMKIEDYKCNTWLPMED